jgi:hypothetical protein
MGTLYTTKRNSQNSTFFQQRAFINFISTLSQNKAIFSLKSINLFDFITDTECVYCAVRTEFLNIIQVTSSL